MQRLLTGLAVLALSGCMPQAHDVQLTSGGKKVTILRCNFSRGFNHVRPDDSVPFTFAVPHDSPWCYDGFNLSSIGGSVSAFSYPSAHGQVVVRGNVTVGYRPDPGYVGHDSFEIRASMEGGSLTFLGSVEVLP